MRLLLPFISLLIIVGACQSDSDVEPRHDAENPWHDNVYFFGEIEGEEFRIPEIHPADSQDFDLVNDVQTEQAGEEDFFFDYTNTLISKGPSIIGLDLPVFSLQLGPAFYQIPDTAEVPLQSEFHSYFQGLEPNYALEDSIEEGVRMEFSYEREDEDEEVELVSLSSFSIEQDEESYFDIVDTELREVTVPAEDEDTVDVESRMYVRANFNARMLSQDQEDTLRIENGEYVTYFLNESE